MSFRDNFYRPDDQTNSVKASSSSRSGINPTRTTPPCYNNTTLGNHLYAERKGPNVTNPICWTCMNCSYKCAANCEHCITIHHRAVLVIFPLNLQTNTITRMLSSERQGDCTVTLHVLQKHTDLKLLAAEKQLHSHTHGLIGLKSTHIHINTSKSNNSQM